MDPIDTKIVMKYSVTEMAIFLTVSVLGYANGVAGVQQHTDTVNCPAQIKQVHAFILSKIIKPRKWIQ